MVAFDENLIAAADTHHLVSEFVVADGVVGRSHGKNRNDQDDNIASEAKQLRHQSPPRAGTAAAACAAPGTRLRAAASAAVMLGNSATPVPKTMMPTPIHIQATRGLRKTLMIGWPVSGFLPA